ncbi:MAG: 16S rRNA (cytidine(1402)-2'-O)-methyltransferase [Bacilli bacterium]
MKRIKSYENNLPICYLVATPIGNLKDISSRALEVLKNVDYIASEDTRTTSNLLSYFGINKPMISYHEHNEQESSTKLIDLLKQGKSIAITSDAGYPGISDPGAIIVKHCIENDIPVSIIPGANAFLPALIGSGLDNNHFYFHGFLPSKPSARKKELEQLTNLTCTLIFYESPHRIKETLNDLLTYFPNRKMSLVREITKLHEEYIYGTINEIAQIDESTLKGEMVIVIEGNKIKEEYTEEELIEMLNKLISNGLSLKEASKELANELNLKKNYLYQLGLK